MKTFTRQDVLSWKPCHGEAETLHIMGGLPRMMTARDVLRHEAATHEDRLWCALREEALGAKTLRLFACWCARRALQRERDAGREPDARLWAAVEVAERFARGEATSDEPRAARAAAWAATRDAAEAAWDATWATAGDAAGDAAWDAAEAATWAASDAAWDATWAARTTTWDATWDAAWAAARAARAAERAAQVEHLLQMLKEEA